MTDRLVKGMAYWMCFVVCDLMASKMIFGWSGGMTRTIRLFEKAVVSYSSNASWARAAVV